MICVARNIPQAALLNWWSSIHEMVVSGYLSRFIKSQATCSVWFGSRGGFRAKAREIGLISIWFWVHRAILHSWSYISVLLVLWLCCWVLPRVQSSKSRLLICLIGKTQLLCLRCRGIGPHLAERGKSHGFSLVVAGTWGIFSSYGGDVLSKLEFVQWSQDTCLGMRDNSGM